MYISLEEFKSALQEFSKLDKGQLGEKVVIILRENMAKIKIAGIVSALALCFFAAIKRYQYCNTQKPAEQNPENPENKENAEPDSESNRTSQKTTEASSTVFKPAENIRAEEEPTHVASSTVPSSTVTSSTLLNSQLGSSCLTSSCIGMRASFLKPGDDWMTQSQLAEERELTMDDLCKSTMDIQAQKQAKTAFNEPTQTIAVAFKNQLGGKLHALYQASLKMQEALRFTQNHATEMGLTAFTLMQGLTNICKREWILGACAIGTAAKAIYNMTSKNSVELDKVFDNIEGNFDAINQLGEQNEAMLGKIDGHIEKAKIEISTIASAFDEIQNLTDEEKNKLGKLYGTTLALHQEAEKTTAEGFGALNQSKINADQAQKLFRSCWINIQKISKLTNQSIADHAKVEEFTTLTSGLEAEFKMGMDYFNASQKAFQDGLVLLFEGQKLHFEAKCGVQLIKSNVDKFLVEIERAAEQEDAIQREREQLQAIENLNNELQKNESQKKEIMQEAQQNVQAAQEMIQKEQQVLLGVASVLAAMGACYSPFAALIVPFLGTRLILEAPKLLTPITDLVTDFDLPTKPGEVKMGFYTKSTGLAGQCLGRPSRTKGVIAIHVGDMIKYYIFNVKEANNGLNIANLAKDLSNAVQKNVLAVGQVESILNQLDYCELLKGCMISKNHPDLANILVEISSL